MKNKLIIISVLTVLLIVIDRTLWMDDRTKDLWIWESGKGFGEPLSNPQDFKIVDSKFVFKEYLNKEARPNIQLNREKELYLLGCYFNRLYIYHKESNEVSLYIRK